MTDPLETPPTAAQEPAGAHASRNGTNPLPPPDLSGELALVLRAIEDVDMRLQSLQVAAALITGLVLLVLVLEVKELRS